LKGGKPAHQLRHQPRPSPPTAQLGSGYTCRLLLGLTGWARAAELGSPLRDESAKELGQGGWQARAVADQRVLKQAFNEHKALLTGAAIGQMLVEVLAHLGGTALRPSGGVYWIPEDAVPAWQGIGVPAVACITREQSLTSVPKWIETVSLE
jgi:hypothetical protein